MSYTQRRKTEKVKNYHLIHVVIHFHIMAVNVSAIRVTPQTRVLYIREKKQYSKLTRVQVMPKNKTTYTHRKMDHICC